MKIKLLIPALFFMLVGGIAQAQFVRGRVGFPVGFSIGAPARTPFSGAVWIGPEWQWRGGNYVCVPGYWARPSRHRAAWVPGHWKYSRRGYQWVPGRWR